MAKGYKHGGGGSGASLNFEVVGGVYSPSAPGENTIWVNTAEEITGWVISPVEPVAGEGKVWITVGSGSDGGFNALKKNALMVYPIGAKQYIDGAWESKAAKIYQEGQWRGFSVQALYLYQPGDTCVDVTGGYVAEARKETTTGSYTAAPAVEEAAAAFVIRPRKSASPGQYYGGVVRTVNKIDCSGSKSLVFEGTVEGVDAGSGKLCLWSEIGSVQSENRVRYVWLQSGSEGLTLDVSDLEGSYYVGFGFDSQHVQIVVSVTSLRLE